MRFGDNRPAPKRAPACRWPVDPFGQRRNDRRNARPSFAPIVCAYAPKRFPVSRAFVADRLFTSDRQQSIKVFAADYKNPDIRVMENASDPRHGDPPFLDQTIRVINTHTHTRRHRPFTSLSDVTRRRRGKNTDAECERTRGRNGPIGRVPSSIAKEIILVRSSVARVSYTSRVNPYAPARSLVSRII